MRGKSFIIIFLALTAAVLNAPFSHAGERSAVIQPSKGDVFVPIAKYIRNGDAEKLSAWFADNIEIAILGEHSECSKAQARQIMKKFFAQYSPKSFTIIHKSGSVPMKYAIGHLNAGAESFYVILLINIHKSRAELVRIRVEEAAE
ncbi:MAG: DUF4783 domain-containing protein [Candidatus Egerieousia sp.]